MHFYLSSYKIGDKAEQLKQLFSANKSVGYIPNALDFTGADPQKREEHIKADVTVLTDLGLGVQVINLRDYFDRQIDLEKLLSTLGGVWISGGNVFVLRQAMSLSGFDEILTNLMPRKDFVYGGYSAAGCVLSQRMDAYQIVDDPTDTPYPEMPEILMDGLGILDYAFLPHHDSDHSETDDIAKEIAYCKKNNIPYKALKDGEVLILSILNTSDSV